MCASHLRPINKSIPEKKANISTFFLTNPASVIDVDCGSHAYAQAGCRAAKTHDSDSSRWPEEHETPCWKRKVDSFSIISNSSTLGHRRCSGVEIKIDKN